MKKHVLNAALAFLMVFAFSWLSAQTTNVIQGTVKDNKGEPVMGASVGVRGTSIGTVTDADGKFSLSVPSTATYVEVKYIGFKTEELEIAKGNFNVTLKEDIMGLDEVVVTAVAIQREKRSLGYATTTVNSEQLNEASPVSALDALNGKVAGLSIDNASGVPGGSTRVVLRGGSSLTGDNNALIVIDGVPIDNSDFGFGGISIGADVLNNQYDAGSRANDINPDDIASVTVLKGAAAVALYGQRGANGAILYTTKSGKSVVGGSGRKFKITVSENIVAETPLKLPTQQNEFGQGSNDSYGNPYFDTRQNWSWGPAFTGQPAFWGTPLQQPNGTYDIRVKPYSAEPDNLNRFFNVGYTNNTNVSIGGGDKGTSFYTSFNNVKYAGMIPTTGYNRNSLKMNIEHDFGDKLTVKGSFTYTNTNSTLAVGGQQNQGLWFMLLNTPRDIPMDELRDLNNPFNQPAQYYDIYYPNPFWVLQNDKTTDNVDHFLTNASIDYKPAPWLTVTGRVGADIYTDTRQQDFATYNYTALQFFQGSFIPNTPSTYIGKYDQDRYTVDNINSDIMANFHKEFKHDVTFGVLLGNNIYSNTVNNTYGETNGLVIPGFYNLVNSNGRPTIQNQLYVNRLLAVYADASIGYKGFLFFDVTARNDWSSTLPTSNRSYFYPGISGSLVFTEIGKKKINPMILSYGKLRASVAQIGKDAPPYQLKNVFVPGDLSDGYVNTDIKTPYVSPASNNIPGYMLSNTLANPNLKPEISTAAEVGFDLGFINDRITLNATYYYKNSVNEILTVPVAPSTGYSYQVINAGIYRNQGVELEVHIIPVSTKSGFKWELDATWTKNISKVIQVANNATQISLGGTTGATIVAEKGSSYPEIYGIAPETNSKGQWVVDSGSGYPIPGTKPQNLGNVAPNWMGSVGTSLSYKGFKLFVLFGGNAGGHFVSQTSAIQQFDGNDPLTTINNREPYVIPNTVYMGSDGQYHPNEAKIVPYNLWVSVAPFITSYNVIAADFVKLREISLTYSIPSKLLAKSKYLTGISVKAYGSNLWLWTPKSNAYVDPELNAAGATNLQGFEFYNAPSARNFGGGITFDF